MCVYSNSPMCLIIDELDAGIYEYLLGELLSVFEKGAKGQLIFTSHNLRALEMLNKNSIVFSTINPSNRYIHLQNIKGNNNLRDMHLTMTGTDNKVCTNNSIFLYFTLITPFTNLVKLIISVKLDFVSQCYGRMNC